MKKENRKNILFRYGSIVCVILLLCVWILYRLLDNTVFSADIWNKRANEGMAVVDTILPVRGRILAADGSVLATNMRVYTPSIDFLTPKFKEADYRKAIPQIADSLAKYFPRRTAKEWKAHLEKPLASPVENRSRAFPIVRNVSYGDVQRIKTFPFFEGKRRHTGLHVDDRLIRVRPYGDMAGRSIGRVGVDSVCNVPFGKYGLERSLDSLLAGRPGYSKKVPLTSSIVDWTDRPPVDGLDVLTTIDIKMQDMLENELQKVLEVCKPKWGTALIMEVSTGDIKAIVNLEADPKHPGSYIESLNRAVMRFEPGSVVKTFSLALWLEDNKIPDINENVHTGGIKAKILGKYIMDHLHTTDVPIYRILEYSSNIAMCMLALRFYGDDPGEFYTKIRRTGVLEPFNTGIAEEMVPKVDSLIIKKGGRLDLTRQAFGYNTEFSPLYTAAIHNAIANGGSFVRPRLVRGVGRGDSIVEYPVSYVNKYFLSPSNAAIVREMLHRVVWGDQGTARKVVQSEKVEIAGKTGTARVYKPNVGYLSNKFRFAFCGFFPYSNPRYTCIAVIQEPSEIWFNAESTSGRVVKNMAEAMYARGMLGNTSDFRNDTKERIGQYPTFYASRKGAAATVNEAICGSVESAALKMPSSVQGVPDAIGLGLRDALDVLERAGYNVSFSGSGYVAGQLPEPGTELRRGEQVTLLLRNDISKNKR